MQHPAKLHGSDRVDIMLPMKPLGMLLYVDFHYETILEIRRKKIEKILDIINGRK